MVLAAYPPYLLSIEAAEPLPIIKILSELLEVMIPDKITILLRLSGVFPRNWMVWAFELDK
jgi:hypothetical protein